MANQRDRSPSYPNIPLGTALERLEAFESHFKRSPARPEKVGEAWGIKAKAYADRTAAALRYFGLIDYERAEKGREIVISEEGRKYLRAQQDHIKQEVVKKAALRPVQIGKFWNLWGVDRPAEGACIDELLFKNGFSEMGARNFLKVYISTIAYAGLSESDKIEVPTDDDGENPPPSPIKVGDLVQIEIDGVFQLQEPKRVRAIQKHEDADWVFIEGSKTGFKMSQTVLQKAEEPAALTKTPPVLPLQHGTAPEGWSEEVLIDDSGEEIKILYRGKASLNRYEFIRDYLDFKINRLKKN